MHFLILSFVIAAVPAAASTTPAAGQTPFKSSAPIAYMVDLSSGSVLYDQNSTRLIPPASMAKMMTAYVVFDMITKKKLRLDQKFALNPISFRKWNNVGSTMFLRANEPVIVTNLLHGILTLSGNDASIALAEGISGSETQFVKRMNTMAKQLGMKDSRFGTANGWPDEGYTLTTARDLAVLARRTIEDFPQLYRTFYGKPEFRWGNITQPDRNPILATIAGADGLKTGHTDEAGFCFTGTANQNGRRLLMVVAGLPSFDSRIIESTAFMKWGFDAWQVKRLFAARVPLGSARVQLGSVTSVALESPRPINVTLPIKGTVTYKISIRYDGPVRAPIFKGQHIADLFVKTSDGREAIVPLKAAKSVAKAGYFGMAWNGIKLLLGIA
jgi:serine-type D-Ala-D-Ala carboxypeptidase (penicillin-binding protein 5/6)